MSWFRNRWQAYLQWRDSGDPPPPDDARPAKLLKADVDPEFMNRQSRALSMEPEGGAG